MIVPAVRFAACQAMMAVRGPSARFNQEAGPFAAPELPESVR